MVRPSSFVRFYRKTAEDENDNLSRGTLNFDRVSEYLVMQLVYVEGQCARKTGGVYTINMKQHTSLLSDQVTEREIQVIMRELEKSMDIPGDVVEFGCYVGTTSVFLAKRLANTGKQLYLYDSFAGLPEKHAEDVSPAGEQFKAGELLATKKELIRNLKQAHVPIPVITKGWFDELQPHQVPGQVSFAFLDGDYYDSILTPLKLLWPKLAPGACVVVDDYANEALPGAARAVDEWCRSHGGLQVRVEASLAIFHKPA